jgi:hypothetical protein
MLVLVLTVATIAAQTKPVALAVLPGERDRAPAEVEVAQIETMLSTDPDIALVERQQIRAVLAERVIPQLFK